MWQLRKINNRSDNFPLVAEKLPEKPLLPSLSPAGFPRQYDLHGVTSPPTGEASLVLRPTRIRSAGVDGLSYTLPSLHHLD
jgi:hypothetical protein